jgi:asparagine N-glycosylation enzyme membrane subunit Stt3
LLSLNLTPANGRRAILGALCGLAFALRLVTLPALSAGGARLLSVDDYGHLRRAAEIVRNFPRVPYADPYLGHPDGGRWIWPPLFDLAIAAPARLLWGAGAPVAKILLVVAWLPPLLGALALLPLAALARRALGDRPALWVAAVYAILPAAIAWSAFGHGDQHVAEALTFLATLAALAAWLGGGRDDWRDYLPVSVALATAVLVWQGAVFLAPILGAAAWLERRSRGGVWILLGSAILVAPWAWIAGGPTTYISFGPFQPLFLGLCAALLALAARGRWGIASAAATALVAGLAWPPLFGALGHLAKSTSAAGSSGAFLAYPKEWLALIGEYRPLLARGIVPALLQLSAGLLALPVAWGFWIAGARRQDGRSAALVVLSCATPVVLAMALAQRRYVYYLAPLVAIALVDLAALLGGRRRVLAGAVVLVALLPVASGISELRIAVGAPGLDLLTTLARLGQLDPPAGDPLRPVEVAPGSVEGVMAPWSIGHLVTIFARRPAVADNFGYGFAEQARFFTTPRSEDAAAYEQLARLRCRYVVVTDLRPVLAAYAAAAARPGVALEDTLAMRLERSRAARPVSFLRLVLVSESAVPDERGEPLPLVKVYRFEPSAPSSG